MAGETTMHRLVLEEKPAGRSSRVNQYAAAVAAAIGAVIAGTVLAWTSPALPQLVPAPAPLANGTGANTSHVVVLDPDYASTTGNLTAGAGAGALLQLTDDQGSWVGSLLAVGALCGALPTGVLVQRLGRRPTMLVIALPFMLNWLLTIFASNVAMLYVARLFAGFATGGICVAAPMYIGEVAETSVRGALGAFFQLFLTVGILLTFAVGGFTSWRVLSAACAALPPLFAAAVWLVPETPQHLLAAGRRRDAERSLRWLRGPDYDVAPELEMMQKEVEDAARNRAGIRELFSNRASVMALVCSLGLMLFQQFSGINAVIFYTEQIFKSAGSNIEPSIAAIIVGVVQTLSTYLASVLVERAGRRILLLQSCVIMGICLVVLGVYFELQATGTDVSGIGWIPLASLVAFIVSFSLGFGPIPWMMMAELFSAEFKGAASGIAVTFNWLLVFLVTKCFPVMVASMGSHYTFWTFAGFMLACTFFTFFVIPETKGKTNLQIRAILAGQRH